MHDDSSAIAGKTSLYVPDLHQAIDQLTKPSFDSRLQLCSLYSMCYASDQRRSTLIFSIDTLIELHKHQSSYQLDPAPNILSVSSSDYCFIPRSYTIYFDYVLDIILQHASPTLILLQVDQPRSSYPKHLFPTLSGSSLRYIYDRKLLGQFLKYVQTSMSKDRRWTMNKSSSSKRKIDDDDDNNDETRALTDEQFIEKLIQHVSNVTQWTDEQRRAAIYTFIIDERQTLLQS